MLPGAGPWVQLAFKWRSLVSGLGPGSTWLFARCQLTDFGHILLDWLKLRRQPGLSVRVAPVSRRARVRRESPGGPGRQAGGRTCVAGPRPPAILPQPAIPGMGCRLHVSPQPASPWSVLGYSGSPGIAITLHSLPRLSRGWNEGQRG